MNILVVDDDKLVIRKVIEIVDWNKLEIHRVFTAESMQQACNVLETFSVDIVVTDVEMPGGNGLELLSWISEKQYPVETIVVSGYAHFAYAQKAMEYGCKRYLLKPVSSKELSAVIAEIIRQKKHKEPENKRHLSDEWKKLLGSNESSFVQELERLDKSDLQNGQYRMITLKIYSDTGCQRGETEERLLQIVVRNVILEFLEESVFELECIRQNSEEEWILLVQFNAEFSLLQQRLKQIQMYFEDTMHLSTCFFISNTGTIGDMVKYYEHFCGFCNEMLFEEQGIIEQNGWSDCGEHSIELPNFDEKLVSLLNGDNQQVIFEMEEYMQELIETCNATKTIFRRIRQGMEEMMHRFLKQHNLNFNQVYEKEQYDQMYRSAESSVLLMKKYIHYVIEKMDELEDRNDRKKQIVEFVKNFIAENISEELTRKMLAQNIHFSEDYIARIFKTETGKSISTYVMEQRMEFAKKYLKETGLTISEIAIRVGYNNFSYFSKTFKDYTGKTPNEFRICTKSTQI